MSSDASSKASWRFLAGAAVGALFTRQSFKPVPVPKVRSVPSFFMGWLTNELAPQHLLWQAMATRAFVRRGALSTWAGWIALALTIGQWGGLIELMRRSATARESMRRAVDSAFPGADETRDAPPIRWSQVALPFPIRHSQVDRTRGIVFSEAGGRQLKLDVYRRRDRPANCPVFLYVHGGAWVISSRDEQGIQMCQEMAALGWTAVNADYRLSPFATFPDHLVDVNRAIAWVREHAREIGADSNFIAASGGSAGSHLIALAALTSNRKDFQPGFEEADTSLQAVVPLYGIFDFTTLDRFYGVEARQLAERWIFKASVDLNPRVFRDASPIHNVGPDAPPCLVVHGSQDSFASPQGAREFVRALAAVSTNPVAHAELQGAQHAFDVFPSIRTAFVLQQVATFLQRAYQRRRSVAAPD